MDRVLQKFKRFVLLQMIAISSLFALDSDAHFEILLGDAIHSRVNDITSLSLLIYREYPYLYEGTIKEYYPIIQHYAKSDKSIACILLDGSNPIGVAIGLPLEEMRENYLHAMQDSLNDAVNSTYYLGEILLIKDFRGKGLGKQLYDKFESVVKSFGRYSTICLCKIEENDLVVELKPENYQFLDSFWKKLGFEKLKNTYFDVFWINVNEHTEIPHQMVFWSKSLKYRPELFAN